MKIIDLHIHSYYSDGEESPSVLLKTAIERGFSIFSIADHNYISSQQSHIQKIALRHGVLFVQGVEVSCVDRKTKESLHILGYSNSFDLGKINRKMSPIVEGYNVREKKIIDKLNHKYEADFDYEEIKKKTAGIFVSRNQLAQKLSEFLGGKIALKKLLPEVFVEEDNSWMPSAKEAIEIIKESNGVAVLAHPGNLVNKDNFENLLQRLVNWGLEGIETYALKHDPDVTNTLNKIAKNFGLIIAAGSDWHGRNLSQTKEGMLVADRVCNKLSEIFGNKEMLPANRKLATVGLAK